MIDSLHVLDTSALSKHKVDAHVKSMVSHHKDNSILQCAILFHAYVEKRTLNKKRKKKSQLKPFTQIIVWVDAYLCSPTLTFDKLCHITIEGKQDLAGSLVAFNKRTHLEPWLIRVCLPELIHVLECMVMNFFAMQTPPHNRVRSIKVSEWVSGQGVVRWQAKG